MTQCGEGQLCDGGNCVEAPVESEPDAGSTNNGIFERDAGGAVPPPAMKGDSGGCGCF